MLRAPPRHAELRSVEAGELPEWPRLYGRRDQYRLAFLSKGDIPPTGLKPHTDTLEEFPYLGTPHPSTK